MTKHRASFSAKQYAGSLLIRAGVIDGPGLERALVTQCEPPASLGRTLAKLGLSDESTVAATLALVLRLEHLEGEPPRIDDHVVAGVLPGAFCAKHCVAPLSADGRTIRIAVTNPTDYQVIQDVEFRSGLKAVAVVATETMIETLQQRLYPADPRATYEMLDTIDPAGEVEASDGEYELFDPALLAKDLRLPPIVKLVNLILSDAANAGASDVHIEPHEQAMQVRQRVDGLLRDVLTVPQHLQAATVSRIKIMSGMDIAERRKPQDGRSRLRFNGRRIDLRVSTLPTQFGEKVVIRLLGSDRPLCTVDQIDLSVANCRLVKGFLANTQGMILVTGPTGSGKSSTLYSAINTIRSATNNIITLEDPIEIQIPGVNQMQVNTRAGVTFAAGLRSILRQDPNVILVGEIRDCETAEIALGAAQTGHLLLSTLHTNDAAATLTRLQDLGVEPFMVASSLIGVIAQRLVRRVCPSCAIDTPLSPELVAKLGGAARVPADARWMTGQGCVECGHSGFKGRIAIHEVLAVTDDVRGLISSKAGEQAVKKAAARNGMRTLLEDGIDKAAQGLTTLDEVFRTLGDAPFESEAAAAAIAVTTANNEPVRGRVLVVDDSPTLTTVVKYFLELEGYDVTLADSGEAGIMAARIDPPDIIVSDVNMPGIGGIEMVKSLRAEPATNRARIVMLTSEADVESEMRGLAAGADDYILKPVEPRRLAARIRALQQRIA